MRNLCKKIGKKVVALSLAMMMAVSLLQSVGGPVVVKAATSEELPGARSESNSAGDVFLGGNYIELGINKQGSFGTSTRPTGSGWHADSNTGAIAMLADGDGWDVGNPPQTGDFVIASSTIDCWVISYSYSNQTYQYFVRTGKEVESADWAVAPTVTDESNLGIGQLKAVVRGVTTHGVEVKITYSFGADDKFYDTKVEVINKSDKQITDVRFLHSFNANQDYQLYETAGTFSKVICNPVSSVEGGVDNYAMVVTRGEKSLSGCFFFLSFDNRARASRGVDSNLAEKPKNNGSSNWMSSWSALWNTAPVTEYTYAESSEIELTQEMIDDANYNGHTKWDEEIAITFNLGSMESGASDMCSYISSFAPDIEESLETAKKYAGITLDSVYGRLEGFAPDYTYEITTYDPTDVNKENPIAQWQVIVAEDGKYIVKDATGATVDEGLDAVRAGVYFLDEWYGYDLLVTRKGADAEDDAKSVIKAVNPGVTDLPAAPVGDDKKPVATGGVDTIEITNLKENQQYRVYDYNNKLVVDWFMPTEDEIANGYTYGPIFCGCTAEEEHTHSYYVVTRYAGNNEVGNNATLPSRSTESIETNVTITAMKNVVDLAEGSITIISDTLYQQTVGSTTYTYKYLNALKITQSNADTTATSNKINVTTDKASIILAGVNINYTDGSFLTVPSSLSNVNLKITIEGKNKLKSSGMSISVGSTGSIEFAFAGSTEDSLTLNSGSKAIVAKEIILSSVMNVKSKKVACFENKDGDTIVDDDEFVEYNPPTKIEIGGKKILENSTLNETVLEEFGNTISYDPNTITLTLNGAEISGSGNVIYADGDLNIIVEKESSINITGAGVLYGIYASGEVTITGNKLNINKMDTQIAACYGIYGYKGVNIIEANISISINSDQSAIYTYNGNVNISDSTVNIDIQKGSGIYISATGYNINLTESVVNITAYNGINMEKNNTTLNISGGNIKVDGNNAGIRVSSNTSSIKVSAGELYVQSFGNLPAITNNIKIDLSEYVDVRALTGRVNTSEKEMNRVSNPNESGWHNGADAILIRKDLLEFTDISAPSITKKYDGVAVGITVTGVPEGAVIKFKDQEGNYTLTESPKYTEASDLPYTVEYEIICEGYDDYTGSATITIEPIDVEILVTPLNVTVSSQPHMGYVADSLTATYLVDGVEHTFDLDDLVYEYYVYGESTILPGAPTEAGKYTLVIRVPNSNYVGSATITFEIKETISLSGTVHWNYAYSYSDDYGVIHNGVVDDTITQRSKKAVIKLYNNGVLVENFEYIIDAVAGEDNTAAGSYSITGLPSVVDGVDANYTVVIVPMVNALENGTELKKAESYYVTTSGSDGYINYIPGCFDATWTIEIDGLGTVDGVIPTELYVKVLYATTIDGRYQQITQMADSSAVCILTPNGDGTYTAVGSYPVWKTQSDGNTYYHKIQVVGYKVNGIYIDTTDLGIISDEENIMYYDLVNHVASQDMKLTLSEMQVPVIEFNANGGTLENSYILMDSFGAEFDLDEIVITKPGYEHIGWSLNGEMVSGTITIDGKVVLQAIWKDIIFPEGTIFIGGTDYTEFDENVSFDVLTNEDVLVEIEASDVGEGVEKVLYYLSDKALAINEVKALDDNKWNSGTNITLSESGKFIVYVKIVDKDGNAIYISTTGMVIDKDAPVIDGIENGKIYCQDQEFSIFDDNLDSIVINGTVVDSTQELYELVAVDGQSSTEYKITVTDKAGNSTTVNVVVNNGHTYEEYEVVENPTCLEDGYKESECEYCDSVDNVVIEKLGHDYETEYTVDVEATCKTDGSKSQHCTRCDECQNVTVIPELGHNWTGEWKVTKEATATEEGRKETLCANGCGQKKVVTIPKVGEIEENLNLEKDAEVEANAPVKEATLNNVKNDLLEASGIFTEEEREDIKNGEEARVWLEISDIDTILPEDKVDVEDKALEVLGENAEVTFFDITMFAQIGENKRPVPTPGVDIEITILIPEELLNQDVTIEREYVIIRLHAGVADPLYGEFDAETGTFTFKTDRFSTYAIAYADAPATGETNPDNGETNPDNGETNPDNGETNPDNGETNPDNGETNPDNGEKPGNGTTPEIPNTGDSNMVYAYLLMLLCGLASIFYSMKRKNFK